MSEMGRLSRERLPPDKSCANAVRKWQVSDQQKELLPTLVSSFPLNVTGARSAHGAKGEPGDQEGVICVFIFLS